MEQIPPDEKAKEIILLYLNSRVNLPYFDTQDGQCIADGYMTHKSAKKCALIHIKGLLEVAPVESRNYLEQVKEQIEKPN